MTAGTSHTRGAPRQVIRLQISLMDSEPLVWRRLLVPAAIRLDKLHRVFQDAMGWTDSHLHMFRTDDDVLYTSYDHDLLQGELDERMSTLEQALGDRTRFAYDYDYGDNWEHDVIIEEKTATRLSLKFAVCIDGQHACPPEDCGGISGYERFREALADPNDDDHDHYTEWIGGSFNPEYFDLAAVNTALQRIH
jgi:Plasmid pRiA4b ORF-3-like protein